MNQFTGTVTVRHQFNENLNLAFISSAQSTGIDSYGSGLPNTVNATGEWYRSLARANTTENDYTSQLNLTGKFNTGFLRHQFLVGTDFAEVLNYSNTYTVPGLVTKSINGINVTYYDLINTLDLNKYVARTDVPDATLLAQTKAPSYRLGYYAQDLISLTDQFKVLAGLRYSIQQTKQT